MLDPFLPRRQAEALHYDANKMVFDKVEVRQPILIKLDPKATPRNKRDQATQQLLVWRNEIITGKAKFEDLAKLYSQCSSKDKGGDIGEFPFKFVVVPEFANTAFAMKPGEISGVVTSVFGVHLIKVTERTPGEPSDFASSKESVREIMAQEEELFQRVLTEQRKSSAIKIELP